MIWWAATELSRILYGAATPQRGNTHMVDGRQAMKVSDNFSEDLFFLLKPLEQFHRLTKTDGMDHFPFP